MNLDELLRDFDYDDFKSRLRNALRCMDLRLSTFCLDAGLPVGYVRSAIDQCHCCDGIERHSDLLTQIAEAFGRDLRWLLTGNTSNSAFTISLREQTHQLVDEFIRSEMLPEEERSQLHEYVEKKIRYLDAHTPQAAYRRGIPQTRRDVAEIYDEMKLLEG